MWWWTIALKTSGMREPSSNNFCEVWFRQPSLPYFVFSGKRIGAQAEILIRCMHAALYFAKYQSRQKGIPLQFSSRQEGVDLCGCSSAPILLEEKAEGTICLVPCIALWCLDRSEQRSTSILIDHLCFGREWTE